MNIGKFVKNVNLSAFFFQLKKKRLFPSAGLTRVAQWNGNQDINWH